jgi:hypothetical protein
MGLAKRVVVAACTPAVAVLLFGLFLAAEGYGRAWRRKYPERFKPTPNWG